MGFRIIPEGDTLIRGSRIINMGRDILYPQRGPQYYFLCKAKLSQ